MSAGPQTATGRPVSFERERGVYDVSIVRDLAHVAVSVDPGAGRTERIQRVFRLLADQSIPIFLIKLHPAAVSFALDAARMPEVDRCLRDVAVDCKIRRDLALVTILAGSMRDLTGVMVCIADALQAAGARLYGVGDSHNSIQCLLDGGRVDDAAAELLRAFNLEACGA